MQFVGVINGELVCHTGIIQFPMRKGWKRVHRFVVLPDYQGIGIGTKFIKEIAKILDAEGYETNLTTTTPSLVGALKRDPDWILIRYNREKSGMKGYGRYKNANLEHLQNTVSSNRMTFSFLYKRGEKDGK